MTNYVTAKFYLMEFKISNLIFFIFIFIYFMLSKTYSINPSLKKYARVICWKLKTRNKIFIWKSELNFQSLTWSSLGSGKINLDIMQSSNIHDYPLFQIYRTQNWTDQIIVIQQMVGRTHFLLKDTFQRQAQI